MANPRCSDADFIELFESIGANPTARRLETTVRNVFKRRESIERKIGRQLKAPPENTLARRGTRHSVGHPGRLHTTLLNGAAIIGSDAHYWPGEPSTAHRAFVKFCKDLKPRIIIKNGDEIDGSTISRHPPIGWTHRPSLIEEIDTTKDRNGEVVMACPEAERYWPLGNHDARFETRLATVAPEYARVQGTQLRDHFPEWQPCWSVVINDDLVVKHRFRSGIHARHNNTVNAGKNIATGHLHNLGVTPFTDYNGTRFGIDTGTLADIYGEQFEYLEDSPRNWRSGFVVLTFRDGMLLWPEVVHVIAPGKVTFRDQVIEV